MLEQPLAILTVVSIHWRRWPSFIVQCVAENGAAVVPGDTCRSVVHSDAA